MKISIGIFAHQEADNIAGIICELAKQSIFSCKEYCVLVYVLANGCTDKTVDLAKSYIENNRLDGFVKVIDLLEGGKSRTWNYFVHEVCSPDDEYVIFCDADIKLPDSNVLFKMIKYLEEHPSVYALNSKPVKDISYNCKPEGLSQKLISKLGGGFSDWKTSICGQLYSAKYSAVSKTYMPIGLPVEDGFIRAAIVTDNFMRIEDISKIQGVEEVWHVYESEKKLLSILNHQVRIVVGSSINYSIFTYLNSLPKCEVGKTLQLSSKNSSWLPELINEFYPQSWGWVPPHFLFKRFKSGKYKQGFFGFVFKMIVGFVFDLIVYLKSQFVLFKGRGPGFW